MGENIAIVVIAYNREKSLMRLLESIRSAYIDYNTTLIISIDKSDNPLVKEYAETFEWRFGEKRIVAHLENLGLRKHILGCGQYLEEFDAIIMLEDDITVSPNFYQFAKQAVDFYCDSIDVAGISLYGFSTNYQTLYKFTPQPQCYDVYFMTCAQSWGQVWMKKTWNDFYEWYKHNSEDFSFQSHLPSNICSWSSKSWLRYHTKYCIEKQKFFVYPYFSFTSNHSDSGSNMAYTTPTYQTSIAVFDNKKVFSFCSLSESKVRYDGFFENLAIPEFLNISPTDLCVDLCGGNGNVMERRYWLTTKPLRYKVLKSYGFVYNPIELNVFRNADGNSIFLYDTYKKSNSLPKTDLRFSYAYLNEVDILITIRRIISFGFFNIIKIIIRTILRKLKK